MARPEDVTRVHVAIEGEDGQIDHRTCVVPDEELEAGKIRPADTVFYTAVRALRDLVEAWRGRRDDGA